VVDLEGRTLTPGLVVAGVGGMWAMGVVLLMWETVGGGPTVAGKWALFLSAVAAAWTVTLMQEHSRRRTCAAIAREAQLLRDERFDQQPMRAV
jgi:F0F1-type ATP synthase assembly protein I